MTKNKKNSGEVVDVKYVINESVKEEIIDIKSLIERFLKNWWLFASSIFVALCIAFLINKITAPQYKVSTSLVINEESSLSNAPAEIMQEIGFFSSDKNFINEVFILKTSPLIQSALDKLDLRISYFQKKIFRKLELYKSAPFIVLLNKEHPQLVDCEIFVKILDSETYQINIEKKDIWVHSFVSNQTTQILDDYETEMKGTFNDYIGNDYFNFKIILNDIEDIEELKEQKFSFIIKTDKNLIQSFKSSMEINPPDIESTVAEITMHSSVPSKSIDFLNSLTESYLQKDTEQKQHISEKTIEYIDMQLANISESLDLAEDDLQQFRSERKVLDVTMQSQQFFTEMNELKNEKARLVVNLKYVEYIQSYFEDNTQYSDLISPAAMGFDDPTLNSLVEELIRLNVEKESFIENNQGKSPYLQRINVRINNLRNMISENIVYIKKTTNIALEDANSRIRQLNAEIQKMPETERELLGIERVFNINNNIYTYLLEKKSEAEIAKASYQPDIEIAEPAGIIGNKPVSPQKSLNYLISFIIGLFFPLGVIGFRDLIRNNFKSAEEIKALSSFPIIGEIYRNTNDMEDVIESFPDSHIAESFRRMNVNLKYLLNNDAASKVIALTSTVSGEGKSFIALNLACILAQNNFRTVLTGFDIRKPREYSMSMNKTKFGISDYLSNQANMEDIIQKTKNQHLDIIAAGKTPPNPAELLATKKTIELLDELKENYDYVIIDTPPIGVVIDGFSLMDKTDLNIYVSRVKHTPKKEFEKIIIDLKDKKIIDGLVINDIAANRKTKYGYNYYNVNKKNNKKAPNSSFFTKLNKLFTR